MNTPQRTLFSPHITYVAPVTHPEPPPLPVSPGSSPAEKGAAIRSIILRKDDQIARLELELASTRDRLREAEEAGAAAAAEAARTAAALQEERAARGAELDAARRRIEVAA